EAERVACQQLEEQSIHKDNNVQRHPRNKLSKDEQIEQKRIPNKDLAVGQELPRILKHKFPQELIGKPIEEIDNYYRTENVFVVINKNHTIFRFSSTSACFLLSPFNLIRRLAIHILTHSIFTTLVMLTIITNCIFMTFKNVPETVEYVFTGIYTFEALTKCLARGFILEKYTFLRDPWNWLDFIVITIAYVAFFVNLGKVAVLRTFRVLRALKTVAVVPGLKTIVSSLIQSFMSLRDVAILSAFILSIFALIGIQLYMGVLRQKCVPTYESFINNSNLSNISYNFYLKQMDNQTYWYEKDDIYLLCGNASGSTKCPNGYVCWKDRGDSPDFGYTSFDNYGWAMLSCFRLMTQDYWENLYQIVLSAAGRYHFFYFLSVIFFGSFYLVNLILAIVSRSYLDQQSKDEAENEENEKHKTEDELQLKNEQDQICLDIQNENKIQLNSMELSSLTFQSGNENVNLILTNEEINKSSYLSQQNSNLTFSHVEPNVESALMTEILCSQQLHRTSIQSKNMNTTNRFGQRLTKTLKMYCCEWTCQSEIFKKFQNVVSFIILDAFVDLFITICIILNTLCMAVDHPGQSEKMTRILITSNYIFTSIFTCESVLKIIALTPIKFLKNPWNSFDLLIVTVSLIELGLSGIKGLSVLRSFRLLRVFKLAKSWQTLNRLMTIIGRSLGALANITLVLSIIVFIFAVMGMQLFGQKYLDKFGKDLPRWHFYDFFHAFMIVFRVLCGEWIESMWICLECAGWPCIPFFLFTYFIGNLVILNLFLALLLASFGSNALNDKDDDENKIAEAIERIQRFCHFIKQFISNLFHRKKQREENTNNINEIDDNSLCGRQDLAGNLPLLTSYKLEELNDLTTDLSIRQEDIEMEQLNNNNCETSRPTHEIINVPSDCCPIIISKQFSCCSKCIPKLIVKQWLYIRHLSYCLVEHRYFELFIIFMILISCTTLALEDIHTREDPLFSKVLLIFDKIFTIIFTLELILKWFAYGIRDYFKTGWNRLDFFIVFISIFGNLLDWFDIANIPAFKSMRTLRALRPLRILSRFEAIKIVVDALFGAIPAIFNVLLVCLIFWLIFSIMGVQLFGGKFFKCVYSNTHQRVNLTENITNKIDCLNKNFTWENSRINFDNVLIGYLALFQVATFKGWTEIMADATDAKELQGGAIEMFMTEDQKKYYNAMKKLGNKKPTKALPRPRFAFGRFLFDVTTNQKFDIFIMICIFLNMVSMCLEHYNQSQTFTRILGYFNHSFVILFTIECLMKLIALNLKYFTIPWNVFDFIIVTASILEQTLGEIMTQFVVNPTLLRVFRVARVGRILRLVKGAKGIRTLLFSLTVSMPALFNIGLLLFLIMFIYSIFGMSFFGYVRKSAGITDLFNFETFPNSMIVLFQMCTTAGWSGVFQALTNDQQPDCDPTIKSPSNNGDCGNFAIATPFLVTFVIITSLVVINMYIAVILENFSQAQEDVEQGLTDDDYDMYYEKWQVFDPSGSQFIRYDQLSDFVDGLEAPLRVSKPNKLLFVVMNLPICENDRMHCVDILDALTKNFLGKPDLLGENSLGAEPPIDIKKDRPKDYHPVTTTLQRQREIYLSRLGLNGFRTNLQRSRNQQRILEKSTISQTD
ncbi:unnamed protein product, partial [Adineta steineri]